jgi:hypothetical protein
LSIAIVVMMSRQALAKRVNHDVTPETIKTLPFAAIVNVKGVGKLKEFEITIKGAKDSLFRPSSPDGGLEIPNDGKAAKAPAVKKTEEDGSVTFTFQLGADQVERARFWFVEDAEDWKRPFPTKGDYYQFILKEFRGETN